VAHHDSGIPIVIQNTLNWFELRVKGDERVKRSGFKHLYIQQQQQQEPSLIPLSGVGYMDQSTP